MNGITLETPQLQESRAVLVPTDSISLVLTKEQFALLIGHYMHSRGTGEREPRLAFVGCMIHDAATPELCDALSTLLHTLTTATFPDGPCQAVALLRASEGKHQEGFDED